MDAKEVRLVSDLYARVSKATFHERDVLALLILLRPRAAEHSPTRELSDFIAHREKDRGALKAYVKHIVDYLDAGFTNRSATLKIDVVHTRDAFRGSLNKTLSEHKLPPLTRESADDVLACVMSLLQDVRLFDRRTEIGRLGLVRLGKDLHLAAQVVAQPQRIPLIAPALIVPNMYCATVKGGGLGPFGGLVEARCTNGRLRLYANGKVVA